MAVATSVFADGGATLTAKKEYLGSASVPVDERTNAETVFDEATDIDADRDNRIGAGVAELALRAHAGACVEVGPFELANITASQTDLRLALAGSDNNNSPAWHPGEVVGIKARIENAVTAGTLNVHYYINDVKQTDLGPVELNTTDTLKKVTTRDPNAAGAVDLAQADDLGVGVTTDGTFAAGTTPTISVWLLVHTVKVAGA